MKKLAIFLAALMLLSCTAITQNHLTSPSGKFQIQARVADDSTLVMIDVYDAQNQLLQTLDTGASDVMKWAAGWNDTQDQIILYSSDIGTQAWEFNGENFEIVPLTEEIKAEAKKLKEEKYK